MTLQRIDDPSKLGGSDQFSGECVQMRRMILLAVAICFAGLCGEKLCAQESSAADSKGNSLARWIDTKGEEVWASLPGRVTT